MINNAHRALFLAIAACAGCAPKAVPDGYQGIVEYDGRVLAFEVSGKIEAVPAKRGAVVKAGDNLASVDASLEKLARDARKEEARVAAAELALIEAGSRKEDVAAASAQLRSAEAALALSEKSHERAASLRQAQSISQAELDRAEADVARTKSEREALEARLGAMKHGARREELERARAGANAATAALALEEARLERFVVHANAPGTIVDVHVEPGELAAPGTPVATIADRGHPFVEVFVPQGELGGIAPGMKADVKVDSEVAPLAGVVEHVASQTEYTPKFVFSERERPNLVVRVRVRVDDPKERLNAGVPAFVRIQR